MKTIDEYMALPYRMEIIEDPYEGGYVALYPELPGCITCGETVESAAMNAIDAKRAWLEAAIEDNNNKGGLNMATVYDVANFFLGIQQADDDKDITPMKLQKLVYFAQGFALALLGHPLFPEPLEAWKHGPVCPELYQKYKPCGGNVIQAADTLNARAAFTQDEFELLMDVYRQYGKYSASTLRNMSHETAPWRAVFAPDEKNVISLDSMRDYFKTQPLERFNDILDELDVEIVQPHLDAHGNAVFEADDHV